MEHGQPQDDQLALNERTPLLSQIDATSKDSVPSPSPSNLRSLLIRPVVAAILNYGALSLIDIACIAILPLYFATPIEFGGLGLPTPQIGVILGIQGLLTGIFQIAFFPRAYRKFGGKIIYAISAAAFIPLTVLWPVTNCVARTFGGTHWMVWVCVGLQQVCFYIGSSAYSEYCPLSPPRLITYPLVSTCKDSYSPKYVMIPRLRTDIHHLLRTIARTPRRYERSRPNGGLLLTHNRALLRYGAFRVLHRSKRVGREFCILRDGFLGVRDGGCFCAVVG